MIEIAIARPGDHPALVQLYHAWGYGAGIEPADRVYVAKLGERPIGLVRRTDERGHLLLRGMHVDPGFQRQQVGTRLLRAFVAELPARDCYCLPFSHLTHFYSREDFDRQNEIDAPSFLRERLAKYRAEGNDILLMRRPAVWNRDRAS